MATMSILTSIRDVFGSSVYRIPNYQRGYAWEEPQVKDLLEDLENIEKDKTHYTGTMVIVRKGEKYQAGEKFDIYEVIDGQQRLTTVLILLFCIYEELKVVNRLQLSREILEKYGVPKNIFKNIYEKYITTGKFSRLKLNEDSNDYFVRHIINESSLVGPDKPANTSQENLRNAKHIITKYLKQKKISCEAEDYFEYLNVLKSKITDNLVINKYEVESDAEAGVIFEVMNDRGKSLSQADKIKNYLIYLAYKIENTDLAGKVNRCWGIIFKNLMASRRSIKDSSLREDYFLRYHWIVYTNDYKNYDIHRQIKANIRLKRNGSRIENDKIEKKISNYIEDLREASDIFLELNQPDIRTSFSDDSYSRFSNIAEIRDTINKFHRLDIIATFYPLFISARRTFKSDPQSFLEIIRLCEVFAFRIYIIGNRRSNINQTAFYRFAFELHCLKEKNDAEKIEKLKEIVNQIKGTINWYGKDESFKENLQDPKFYHAMQSNEIKYFFFELERYKAKELKEELGISWSDIEKKTQIEHIWPQTPKDFDTWTDKEKEKYKENIVHRLGNLTITGWNQALSNKDFWDEEEFKCKKNIYARSNLRVQRELVDYYKWNENKINKREDGLIKFALERWRYNNQQSEVKERETQQEGSKQHETLKWSRDKLFEFLGYRSDIQREFLRTLAEKDKVYNDDLLVELKRKLRDKFGGYTSGALGGLNHAIDLAGKEYLHYHEWDDKGGYYKIVEKYRDMIKRYFSQQE